MWMLPHHTALATERSEGSTPEDARRSDSDSALRHTCEDDVSRKRRTAQGCMNGEEVAVVPC